MANFFSDSSSSTAETQEDWIQSMADRMTPEEVLRMWEEKIGNREFLLIFIRLLHLSESKHGKLERERTQAQGRSQNRSSQSPSQGMTLQDILNAMSKN